MNVAIFPLTLRGISQKVSHSVRARQRQSQRETIPTVAVAAVAVAAAAAVAVARLTKRLLYLKLLHVQHSFEVRTDSSRKIKAFMTSVERISKHCKH